MTAEKLPSPHGGFTGMQLWTSPTSRAHQPSQPHYCATVLHEALILHNFLDTHQKGVSGASSFDYVNIAKRLDECHTIYYGRGEVIPLDLRRMSQQSTTIVSEDWDHYWSMSIQFLRQHHYHLNDGSYPAVVVSPSIYSTELPGSPQETYF